MKRNLFTQSLSIRYALPSVDDEGAPNENVPVTSIELDESQIEIPAKGTQYLFAKVYPENATNPDVVWSSSNEDVASVFNGKVITHKEGLALITAETVDGHFTASCTVSVISLDKQMEGFKYYVHEQDVVLKEVLDETVTEVVVPSCVTKIADWAFLGCKSLKFVFIGENVTSIGRQIFSMCSSLTCIVVDPGNSRFRTIDNNLYSHDGKILYQYAIGQKDTSFSVPEGVVHIGEAAFESCQNLETVIIPDSVTAIDFWAFGHCTSLANIVVHDHLAYIGEKAFQNTAFENNPDNWENDALYLNDYLINAHVENSSEFVVREGTTLIASFAFESKSRKLKSVVVPEGVVHIGERAFSHCPSLEAISLPKSITHINSGAFDETEYYKNENNWENGALYINNCLIDTKKDINGEYKVKDGTLMIADFAFFRRDEIESVILPDTLIAIGRGAFSDCRKLKYMSIPDSVTTLGFGAFAYCYSLENVTLSNNLTLIDSYVFYDCYNLNDIIIPNSVTSIETMSFYGCESLTDLTIPSSVKTIGNMSFCGCVSLSNLSLSNGVTTIGDGALLSCNLLSVLCIPDSVTSIGNSAFQYCSSLKEITIGDNVTSIGSYILGGTEYVNNKDNWENNSLYLGKYLLRVLYDVSGEYIVKEGTKVIANCAFAYCDALTSIVIPNSVTNIGERAFFYCENLKDIVVGSGVTFIGGEAFFQCEKLENLYFNGTNEQWDNISFGYEFFDVLSIYKVLIHCSDDGEEA